MLKFSKKIFFIVSFSFVFLSSFFVNIALAEVTCCGCSTRIASVETERITSNFECGEGSLNCNTMCREKSSTGIVVREIEGIRATGEVVTCCVCADTSSYICDPSNRICDTLCGEHGGSTDDNTWRRYPETTAATETTKDETSKVELMPPNLNIDIPGSGSLFGGGQIVKEGEERYFYLPYIGEYVSALYNYVLGIVGILAVVVIIFAGGIWLTAGGSPERIKTAQEYIFGAVTGVVLAFGSYLILYTINPDLVRFAAIKIKVVENMPIPEGNFSIGSENPRDPENRGEYEVIARRIAEEYSINGCLFATQIGMESGWDPSAHSDCCYGLGQVHWNNARNILSRNRGEITQRHSQGCPTCPQGNATEENIGQWLMNDSEGNLIKIDNRI